MNARARVSATLAGEPTDRRAFAPVLGLYGARLTGCPLERYFTDPAAYAEGQAAVRETFDPDVLCAPLAFSAIGAAFGGKLHYSARGVPRLQRPAVTSARDWDNLVMPDPDAHPLLLFFREAIRRMRADHGDEVPIAMVIPIAPDIPEVIMGLESWLETVLFDRLAAEAIMERILPFHVNLVNRFFEDGATLVVMPCGFASSTIVTRDIASGFTRPLLERALSQSRGPVVLHNVGARMVPNLDLLAGLPNVVGFICDQEDDLGRAREIVGHDPVLFGGIDCANLARMGAAEVTVRVRALLAERRADRRLALGTSGPDVPLETPPENIHAFRAALAEEPSLGGAS